MTITYGPSDPNGDTFGAMMSEPDTGPAYAAAVSDDGWYVYNHKDRWVIVNGLNEEQALKIAEYLNLKVPQGENR